MTKRKTKSKYTAAEFKAQFTANSKGKAVKRTEDKEQANICKWIKSEYPNILYTVDMGGVNLSPAQLKIHGQRCKRGHPDIMIQEWFKDDFCGLAIEYKKTGEKVNSHKVITNPHLKEQYEYILDLKKRCWMAFFVCGEENAKRVIDLYLNAPANAIEKINQLVFPKI